VLSRLYISNFALINEMDVKFPGHLTVITGETGAGKSIFLEGLALALGRRADVNAVRNKLRKCIVEAEFELSGLGLEDFFKEQGLDYDCHVTLRREISADGRSRSFLNENLVGLGVLKSFSERLIDVHSQHQTLQLNQGQFQLEMIDAFAGTQKQFEEYRTQYKLLKGLEAELQKLQQKETEAKKELDYLQFLYDELDGTEITSGLLKKLEEESLALENAEMIKGLLQRSSSAMNEGEQNVLSSMSLIKQSLNSISKFGKAYTDLHDRLSSIYFELKDLSKDLEAAAGKVSVDNKYLSSVNDSIDRINRLLKKHSVQTEEGLLESKEQICKKLEKYSSLGNEIEKAKKKITETEKFCKTAALKISEQRLRSIPEIESEVKKILSGLSMENAVFRIECLQVETPGSDGIDQVRFMFSANKGVAPGELHKVASGGELSRLMLSIKALLANKKALPAIIFDEIDTGVSGDVANKIGEILFSMGKKMQVITITHLAQMASKGDHHLFVYKKDDEDKTASYIRELSREERIIEIAKMLSTSNPTQSALKNAKELLSA
jgi:DNA repair protein RecN (Recombination protein N)